MAFLRFRYNCRGSQSKKLVTKCTKFTISALTQTDISYEQKSDSRYWHHGWKIMPYQDSGIEINGIAEKNTSGRNWYQ